MNPDSDDPSEAPDPEEPARRLPAAFHPDMQDEQPKLKSMDTTTNTSAAREAGQIDITGIPKAKVLAALFNASHQQGMGFLQARGARGMTEKEAEEELAFLENKGYPPSFDYLHGRVMKVDISRDSFNPRLFDRDNGEGAAALAIEALHH